MREYPPLAYTCPQIIQMDSQLLVHVLSMKQAESLSVFTGYYIMIMSSGGTLASWLVHFPPD